MTTQASLTYESQMAAFEKDLLTRALWETDTAACAAERLALPLSTLRRRARALGVERPPKGRRGRARAGAEGATPARGVFVNLSSGSPLSEAATALLFGCMAAGLWPRTALEARVGQGLLRPKLLDVIGRCAFSVHVLDDGADLRGSEDGFLAGMLACMARMPAGQRLLLLAGEGARTPLAELFGDEVCAYDGSGEGALAKLHALLKGSCAGLPEQASPLLAQYQEFSESLPDYCTRLGTSREELTAGSLADVIFYWLKEQGGVGADLLAAAAARPGAAGAGAPA